PLPGASGTQRELEAFAAVQREDLIRARELGEEILNEDPSSFIAHLVLAHVHHYAEANFPRAVYHARKARTLSDAEYGEEPEPSEPWRWHPRILRELASSEQEVGNYERALAVYAQYNERYQPRIVAGRAWSLMKLGRYEDARVAAAKGLASGRPRA